MEFNVFGKKISISDSTVPQQGREATEHINKGIDLLKKYKKGKEVTEAKIVENEKWYKSLHWDIIRRKERDQEPEPVSAYLFNTIISKHADAIDNFPGPNILPREVDDEEEAKMLTEILPLVLDNIGFRKVYSDGWFTKLKNGWVPYGVFWNNDKGEGLGDIDVHEIDPLNLYWQPGIKSIQDSRNLFIVELVDDDILEEDYPDLDFSGAKVFDPKQYETDDNVDNTDCTLVVDWYYKVKDENGNSRLHFTKFANDQLLYSSEINPDAPLQEDIEDQAAPTEERFGKMDPEDGQGYVEEAEEPAAVEQPEVIDQDVAEELESFYAHGMYPVVIDVLFPEKGTPIGFGYVDVLKNPQMYVDKLDQIISRNALQAGKQRHFVKDDGSVNKKQLMDWDNELIEVAGDVDDTKIRPFQANPLPNYVSDHRNNKINEMKEISGSSDFSRGEASKGVTAASAIMALQEASNKTSRDMIFMSYHNYADIVYLIIELIREFYEETRNFRVEKEDGSPDYVGYNNSNLKESQMQPPTDVPMEDMDPGYRKPLFDIKVKPEKKSPFSQAAHNEMAKEFYGLGLFNPEAADQALIALEMMQFEGKDKIVEKVTKNQRLAQALEKVSMENEKLKAIVQQTTGEDLGINMEEIAEKQRQQRINGGQQ